MVKCAGRPGDRRTSGYFAGNLTCDQFAQPGRDSFPAMAARGAVLLRYRLSLEEFYSWQRAMDRAGVPGLRVAWSQQDRASRRHHRETVSTRLRELVAV